MSEWTPEEREAIGRLPREIALPPQLEGRVMEALRSEKSRRHTMKLAAAAAICIGLFAGGFVSGRVSEGTPAAAEPTFVIFLREGGASSPEHVNAVRKWARAAVKEGTLVGGEKLTGEGAELVAGRTRPRSFASEGEIGGFLLITARDIGEATRIASTIPRDGGVVEVRAIEELPPQK